MSKYFFGKGEFKDVLTCLSTTKVNSYKTSSLPLADFWNPEKSKELERWLKKLQKEGIDIIDSDRYFEYPTPCMNGDFQLPHSKPSMTDLMIINEKYQVAVEGKYTEYSESNYETIKDWNKKNEPHKINIKNQWFKYIHDCGASDKSEVTDDIPYQFLHRTASACYECEGKTPVLVYQLFFDSENESKKNEFIEELKRWSRELGFTDKIRFLIVEVEIKNIKDVRDKYDGIRSDLFLIMRESKVPIYNFDWDNIKITEVKA